MSNLILHARFIEVQESKTTKRIVSQVVKLDHKQFNVQQIPASNYVLQVLCKNSNVTLFRVTLSQIQQEINDYFSQFEQVEVESDVCVCGHKIQDHYENVNSLGQPINHCCKGSVKCHCSQFKPQTTSKIVYVQCTICDCDTPKFNKNHKCHCEHLDMEHSFREEMPNQIPDLSDGRVHTFEMDGLKIWFALMNNNIEFRYSADLLEKQNAFLQILHDLYGDTSIFNIEHFPQIYQKLLDYKASLEQPKEPKYKVEWNKLFPIELKPATLETSNMNQYSNDDWYKQGMNDGALGVATRLDAGFDGLEIWELKVWSE